MEAGKNYRKGKIHRKEIFFNSTFFENIPAKN